MVRTLAALVAAQLFLARGDLLAQGPVRWSGYIQARETYRDGPGLTGSINRARLSASGGGAKDVTWRVQGEFRTGSVGIQDYGGDSTRFGLDVSLEYRGATFRAEYVTQHRDDVEIDDEGWYAQGACRVVPWMLLVLKLEDFDRDGISLGSRNNATTGGVNVEFPGGKVRLLVNYVSREAGEPGNRTDTVLGQAQVKF
jgi:hypothetical protein